MIGDPLEEDIVGGVVVRIGHQLTVGIQLLMLDYPALHLVRQVLAAGIYALLLPERIGFQEEGEANQAMGGHTSIIGLLSVQVRPTTCQEVLVVGYLAALVLILIDLVAHHAQCIEKSASFKQTGIDEVALPLRLQCLAEVMGRGLVARRYNPMHLMNDAVQHGDIVVAAVYQAVAADEERVNPLLGPRDGQLVVA